MWLVTLLSGLWFLDTTRAAVTVYSQLPLGQPSASVSASAAAANYTGAAAYDPTILNAPGIPNPAPPTQPFIQLFNSNTSQGRLSIPISGSFYGFSIETSVVNQVLGFNSTLLQVPFLNLMAILKQRGGEVHIRVGGNTQETATIVDSIPGGRVLTKAKGNSSNPAWRGCRPATYSPEDYFNEFGVVMTAINNDANIPIKNNIIGPSISASQWTGYIQAYTNNLGMIAVEKYPDDNCLAVYGSAGQAKNPQTEFPEYLDHNAGINIVKPFLNASAIALTAGKPFLMFETNTASCGGFPGISDSYGSALWALDYGLQMALGPTGTAQVVDLNSNNGNIYTPAYAIYEKGTLARVALFNFVTDTSGGTAGRSNNRRRRWWSVLNGFFSGDPSPSQSTVPPSSTAPTATTAPPSPTGPMIRCHKTKCVPCSRRLLL